jgi:putative hemolysin
MLTTAAFLLTLILLFLITYLSLFEMSLTRTSKVTVRRLQEKSSTKQVAQLKALVENRLEGLVSIYVGIQVCMVTFAILMTGYLHSQFHSYAKALPSAVGVMFLVVVIFRQLIPRMFTYKKPERVLLVLLPLHDILKPALNLLAYPLSSSLRLFQQLNVQEEPEKTEEHIEEEIQAYIDVGKEQGLLEKGDEHLIQSVFEFGDKVAGDIMTPRTEMVAIDINASMEKLKSVMVETKYSRLPVYRDHVENIVGMVYLKDVIDVWDDPSQALTIQKLLRPIQFVPETKRVTELLSDLQHKASHIAVVVDEYGGVAGLVSIEDILEEITGEIHDEDEAAEIVQILQDKEGNYLIPGSIPIQQVEELFQIDLENVENSTIAGYVTSVFGRVPKRGESCDLQGLRFEVKEADRRRIYKLLVRRSTTPEQIIATGTAD